jgi:glycerol dehydrogenase
MASEAIEYNIPAPLAKVGEGHSLPRIFGSPARYVQGAGVVEQAGHYLSRLGFRHCAALLSCRSQQAEGGRVIQSAREHGLSVEILDFGGECSFEEIGRCVTVLRALAAPVDGLIAVGGGKVVDAGRAVARRLDIPVAVVSTLASNDAPCAAVSVIYTPEGVTANAEIYDVSPALVLVDTEVIALADERYLAAGMGDAMATWYEARACASNPAGVNVFGARPTLAGTALAELCARTIYAHGEQALASVRESVVSNALEQVVEANTLLSGLGYESGGLAVCHAVAQGFTVLENVHRNYLHGEMVAMGVLTQLMLESDPAEAARVARFFATVGLPVHLGQLGLSPQDADALDAVIAGAMGFPYVSNMPFEVDADSLRGALLAADRLGRDFGA